MTVTMFLRSQNYFSLVPGLWSDRLQIRTGCRFVHLEFSGLYLHQYVNSKKIITQTIKQATMSIIFSARARVACRFQSTQTIAFGYQCDSAFRKAVKFRNHAEGFQHSLPILISDGEKIILLYAIFTYITSQCQKCLQISILWAEAGSIAILFNSITFKIVYGNSLYQLF